MQKYTQVEVAGLAGVSPSSIQRHMNKLLIDEPSVIVGRRRHYNEAGKDSVVAYFRALHQSRFEKYREFI